LPRNKGPDLARLASGHTLAGKLTLSLSGDGRHSGTFLMASHRSADLLSHPVRKKSSLALINNVQNFVSIEVLIEMNCPKHPPSTSADVGSLLRDNLNTYRIKFSCNAVARYVGAEVMRSHTVLYCTVTFYALNHARGW
jgi:hypothetical protein